jgi:hypothetical protein
MFRSRILAGFAVLTSATIQLGAQIAPGGSVSGYVYDQQDRAIPGALVIVASPTVPGTFTARTNATGHYEISNLTPATYDIRGERPGFAAAVRQNVAIREGLNVRVDFTLGIGSSQEVVIVTAEPPQLESKYATQGFNVSGDLQRALPLSSLRTWGDFLMLVPGVATTQARFQTYTLHGTSPSSGVFLVDGADATSVLQGSTLYSQFSRATFNDIQVKTGAVDAASPLGLGVVANIATQSGTDAVMGSAAGTFQAKRWNDSNTPGGQDLTTQVRQAESALGGPFVRGRFWFLGSLRLDRSSTGVPRSQQQAEFLAALAPGFEPFDNTWRGQGGFLKLTARTSPRDAFTGSWSKDVTTYGGAQPNEPVPFREIVIGGPSYVANIASTWTDSLLTRVSLGYNGRRQTNRNLQPEATGVVIHQSVFPSGGRLIGTGPLVALKASPFPGIDFDTSMWTFTGDTTFYLIDGGATHEVQAGLYLQPHRRNGWTTRYNNHGFQLEEFVLRDPSNPGAGIMPFHRQTFDVSQIVTTNVDSDDVAVYAQDAWRRGRLTITGGVRVDFVTQIDRNFGAVTRRSTEIGPRVGFTYLLSRDQKSSARSSWTRRYENLSQSETQAGANLPGVTDLYGLGLDGADSTMFDTPARQVLSDHEVIDLDHYHLPRVDEWLVGYSRQIPGATTIDLSLMRREYRDRPAAVEINGIYDGNVFKGYRDETKNEIYLLTANIWNRPVVNVLQVALAKRSRHVELVAAYTREWNALIGTWQPHDPASFIQPDAFRNRGGIGFVNGCSSGPSCSDANSLAPVAGGSGSWRSHVVNAGGAFEMPWRLSFATSYNFQSGPWSGPILASLGTPDPAFGPATVTLSNGRVVSNPLATPIRFANATRDSGQLRLPPLHIWNARVGHRLSLGRRPIEVALDVLNVINAGADQAFSAGANQEFSPVFGLGSMRQLPRAAELSVRVLF